MTEERAHHFIADPADPSVPVVIPLTSTRKAMNSSEAMVAREFAAASLD